ncbi:MAG: ABC transporter, ABC-2 type transport system ATP-binding protein [Candidatus Rokubacteria bacterium CSP1-6]|nr:MAG: ABC transporter, ABC-2 type transport system ATP-binding protein [Candidatus Rokubacteria bacterium CSP1-6]
MAAPDGHPLLRLDRLSKRFGDRLAVEALTLEVAPGEIYCLIGPNGSGKTTTVKMIAGLYRPTAGQVLIAGIDLGAEPERAKGLLGYIPDEPFVYEKMTGREFLGLVAALYRVAEPERTRRIEELLDLYALGAAADGYVEHYSRGNRQKLAILASLLHAPRLLVVDEPIVGLDPESAIKTRDLVRRFAEMGGSALLCTHTLAFAEQVCHRVGLLTEGRLVEEGDLAALRRRAGLPDASLEALYLHFTKARPS